MGLKIQNIDLSWHATTEIQSSVAWIPSSLRCWCSNSALAHSSKLALNNNTTIQNWDYCEFLNLKKKTLLLHSECNCQYGPLQSTHFDQDCSEACFYQDCSKVSMDAFNSTSGRIWIDFFLPANFNFSPLNFKFSPHPSLFSQHPPVFSPLRYVRSRPTISCELGGCSHFAPRTTQIKTSGDALGQPNRIGWRKTGAWHAPDGM
jgi:hypothetical protein